MNIHPHNHENETSDPVSHADVSPLCSEASAAGTALESVEILTDGLEGADGATAAHTIGIKCVSAMMTPPAAM